MTCCIQDEGGSLDFGNQAQSPNYSELPLKVPNVTLVKRPIEAEDVRLL